MKRQKVVIVAGARPNFMKISPLMREFRRHEASFDPFLVHTGQHYDFQMSEVFFQHLEIPRPTVHLDVGSGSHAAQTAAVMVPFEKVLLQEKPDLVMVVGDVNSTVACALVATKLCIKVAHVEAGLRSFDRAMPEEINRIVTDCLSDYLFVSEESGVHNLRQEGIAPDKVHFVGNVMIDTLLSHMEKIDRANILERLRPKVAASYYLEPKKYAVMTLHRPSNVDSKESLSQMFEIIQAVSEHIPIICPIHPRTKMKITTHGFVNRFHELQRVLLIDPLGYIPFIKLVKESSFVLTDSGGIQEETTVLGIPCLTMRENTERPATIEQGTNVLVGRERQKILSGVDEILSGHQKHGSIPALWDGKAAERIVEILLGHETGESSGRVPQPEISSAALATAG